MNSYDALAGSYDGLMADGAYLRRADYIERQFRRGPLPVRTVLDLGCGTGTLSHLLASRGYEVIATDGSQEMLTEAMRKGGETRPLFLCQPMPRLRLLHPVDAAISTLDSLNYLTRERDIKETFRRVHRWLKPGGQFLFDVNTPHKLRRMDRQLYTDETEESYCVWRTFFSEKTQVCTYQVDLFQLRPDGNWSRSFEEHRERAWSEAQLRAFLQEAGFVSIRLYGDLSRRPPKPNEDRWIFTASKEEDT